ncbi:MAG TPA: hypothetical protein VF097_04200 [Actinomycetota bacterium]
MLLIVGLALLATPRAASADKPSAVCPPGFNLGALDFESSLSLSRSKAGLEDGFFTSEGLETSFDFFDKNGDGLVCFQESVGSTQANPASLWQYLYNVVDNSASKP